MSKLLVTSEIEELIHLRQRVQEADLEKYQNLLKDFLGEIKAMMADQAKLYLPETLAGNHRLAVTQPQVFLSYAWEVEGTAKYTHLHTFLKYLAENLGHAGLTAWLDLQRMTGNLETQMRCNIKQSQYILLIGTQRYAERTKPDSETNVYKELKFTLDEYEKRSIQDEKSADFILPLMFEGDYKATFSTVNKFLIRDCRSWHPLETGQWQSFENYIKELTQFEPLGILPTVLGISRLEPELLKYRQACREQYIQKQKAFMNTLELLKHKNRELGEKFRFNSPARSLPHESHPAREIKREKKIDIENKYPVPPLPPQFTSKSVSNSISPLSPSSPFALLVDEKKNSSEECDSYLLYVDEKGSFSSISSLSSTNSRKGNELLVIDLTERLSILTVWRDKLSLKQSQSFSGQTKKEIERVDKLISQLEKQRLAASSESKQPTPISPYEEVKVPGDGHCLYSAVGLYVGKDQKQLREQVAHELESKPHTYEPFLELKSQQIPKQYIDGVRSGLEWAGNVEIAALMHILQRPIIVVRPGENSQLRAENPTKLEKQYATKGLPILVRYNGKNHYNALILVVQDDPNPTILPYQKRIEAKLAQLIKDEKLSKKNAYVFIRTERDFSCIYIKNGTPQSAEQIRLKPNSPFNRIELLVSQLDSRIEKNGYILLTPQNIQIITSNTSYTPSGKSAYEDAKKYHQEKNYVKAREQYEIAWSKGIIKAGTKLAVLLLRGVGSKENEKQADKVRAFNLLTVLAASGDILAMNNLAEAYRCGVGVSKDEKEAAKWQKKYEHTAKKVSTNNAAFINQINHPPSSTHTSTQINLN